MCDPCWEGQVTEWWGIIVGKAFSLVAREASRRLASLSKPGHLAPKIRNEIFESDNAEG